MIKEDTDIILHSSFIDDSDILMLTPSPLSDSNRIKC